jgi:hypothetical protein
MPKKEELRATMLLREDSSHFQHFSAASTYWGHEVQEADMAFTDAWLRKVL